jgi:C4-dicarboxylate-specific signal transduction histidine kinase
MNAIEAIRVRGDGPREILVISQEEGPDEIVVTARDSAIGIDTEKMAQLFRPLLTAKSAGLGMGLSISRSLLEARGGRLWAGAQ